MGTLSSWSFGLELDKQINHSLITQDIPSSPLKSFCEHVACSSLYMTAFDPQVFDSLGDFVPQVTWCVMMLHELVQVSASQMIRIISDQILHCRMLWHGCRKRREAIETFVPVFPKTLIASLRCTESALVRRVLLEKSSTSLGCPLCLRFLDPRSVLRASMLMKSFWSARLTVETSLSLSCSREVRKCSGHGVSAGALR